MTKTEARRATATELAAIAGMTDGCIFSIGQCPPCDTARTLLAHIAHLNAVATEREADLCALVGEVTRMAGEIEQMRGVRA